MTRYDRIARGDRRGSRSGPRTVALALTSWAVFVLALGLAGVAAAVVEDATASSTAPDVGRWLVRAVPAAVTLAITVPLLLVVHRRR